MSVCVSVCLSVRFVTNGGGRTVKLLLLSVPVLRTRVTLEFMVFSGWSREVLYSHTSGCVPVVISVLTAVFPAVSFCSGRTTSPGHGEQGGLCEI